VLEKMIEVRFGRRRRIAAQRQAFPSDQRSERQWRGLGGVLNPGLHTFGDCSKLAPEVQQFHEAAKLVARMQNMYHQPWTRAAGSTESSRRFADRPRTRTRSASCFRRDYLYKRYQTQKDNPDLAQLL